MAKRALGATSLVALVVATLIIVGRFITDPAVGSRIEFALQIVDAFGTPVVFTAILLNEHIEFAALFDWLILLVNVVA